MLLSVAGHNGDGGDLAHDPGPPPPLPPLAVVLKHSYNTTETFHVGISDSRGARGWESRVVVVFPFRDRQQDLPSRPPPHHHHQQGNVFNFDAHGCVVDGAGAGHWRTAVVACNLRCCDPGRADATLLAVQRQWAAAT